MRPETKAWKGSARGALIKFVAKSCAFSAVQKSRGGMNDKAKLRIVGKVRAEAVIGKSAYWSDM